MLPAGTVRRFILTVDRSLGSWISVWLPAQSPQWRRKIKCVTLCQPPSRAGSVVWTEHYTEFSRSFLPYKPTRRSPTDWVTAHQSPCILKYWHRHWALVYGTVSLCSKVVSRQKPWDRPNTDIQKSLCVVGLRQTGLKTAHPEYVWPI